MLDKKEITLVLYHANCIDGLASASIVNYFYENESLDQPKFIACRYNEKLSINFTDEKILVVDFSFDEETTKRMILETSGNLLIIDHHATSLEKLDKIDSIYKVFDNKYCGAVLTWKYFFPTIKIPEILYYINDYDLWNIDSKRKWKEMNILISYLLASETKKISFMSDFLRDVYNNSKKIEKLVKRGEIYSEYINSIVEKNLNSVRLVCIADPLDETSKILLAIVNLTNFVNETADKILQTTPKIDAVITYTSFIEPAGRAQLSCSVRTKDYPAHLFAEKFGGGGHPQASGFRCYERFPFVPIFTTYYSNYIQDRQHLVLGIEYDILKKYFKVERGIFLRLSNREYKKHLVNNQFHCYIEELTTGDKVLCQIDAREYREYHVIECRDSLRICTDE